MPYRRVTDPRRLQQLLEAVLILEAVSLEAAQETLAELPLVGNDIIAFELIELHPFTAFERLFRDP